MHLLRHTGLDDLPHFPSEEVLSLKTEFVDASTCERPKPYFVRAVKTSGPEEPLKKRLARADAYFNRLAALCGIQVVKHRWGLARETPYLSAPNYEARKVVPAGYLLVARVATIIPAGPLPQDIAERCVTGMDTFARETATDPSHYIDVKLEQVMYGTEARRLPHHRIPGGWYHDIDPVMHKPNA